MAALHPKAAIGLWFANDMISDFQAMEEDVTGRRDMLKLAGAGLLTSGLPLRRRAPANPAPVARPPRRFVGAEVSTASARPISATGATSTRSWPATIPTRRS